MCLLQTKTYLFSHIESFHTPLRVGYITAQFSFVLPFGSLLFQLKYLTANVDVHIHLSEAQSVAPIHAYTTFFAEKILYY